MFTYLLGLDYFFHSLINFSIADLKKDFLLVSINTLTECFHKESIEIMPETEPKSTKTIPILLLFISKVM